MAKKKVKSSTAATQARPAKATAAKSKRRKPKRERPRASRDDSQAAAESATVERLDPGQVIVRMYRQGLGDCFLLAFGSSHGPRYVLIDCGVHDRQTKGPVRLLQVMRHLAAATGNRLHVVVATHEHADHLSGFVQKNSPFLLGQVKIDDLWVGWTEKIGDEQADRLRKKFGCARKVIDKVLKQTIEKARSVPQMAELGAKIAGLTDFERPPENSVDVDEVLARIKSLAETPEQESMLKSLERRLAPQPTMEAEPDAELGAAKKKRTKPSSNELALALLMLTAKQVTYCEPKRKSPLTLSGVPELRAYVLGPPRDQDLLEQDKPSKIRGATDEHGEPQYKEVYLSRHAATRALQLAPVLGAAEELGEDKHLPDDFRYPFKFERRRVFKEEHGKLIWTNEPLVPQRTQKIVQENYLGCLKTAGYGEVESAQDAPPGYETAASRADAEASLLVDQSWRRIDGDWLGSFEQLALDLDGDTNNTSLVLAFELGKPGIGPVLLFAADAQVGNWLSWRNQTYQAADKKITADDLLRRTALYKVGHHGSHNATVKRDPRETSDSHEHGIPFGLELMDGIVAMIPVDRDAADKKMPRPWKMPHLPLYKRLREKAQRRVLRSDLRLEPLDEGQDDADLTPGSPRWSRVPGMGNARWRRSAEQFTDGTEGPLYYEVLFEVGDE
jgi:hypothetical protein